MHAAILRGVAAAGFAPCWTDERVTVVLGSRLTRPHPPPAAGATLGELVPDLSRVSDGRRTVQPRQPAAPRRSAG